MPFLTALRVTFEPIEEGRLIRVAGEVDAGNSEHLQRYLDDARQAGGTTLLDMANVEFLDSAGLEVLLSASQAGEGNDWAFFIVRPSRAVRRLVEVTETTDRLALIHAG